MSTLTGRFGRRLPSYSTTFVLLSSHVKISPTSSPRPRQQVKIRQHSRHRLANSPFLRHVVIANNSRLPRQQLKFVNTHGPVWATVTLIFKDTPRHFAHHQHTFHHRFTVEFLCFFTSHDQPFCCFIFPIRCLVNPRKLVIKKSEGISTVNAPLPVPSQQ